MGRPKGMIKWEQEVEYNTPPPPCTSPKRCTYYQKCKRTEWACDAFDKYINEEDFQNENKEPNKRIGRKIFPKRDIDRGGFLPELPESEG